MIMSTFIWRKINKRCVQYSSVMHSNMTRVNDNSQVSHATHMSHSYMRACGL